MTAAGLAPVARLARLSVTTADIRRLAAFYEQAFGMRQVGRKRPCGARYRDSLDVEGDVERITFALGDEVVEMLEFERAGRPYPAGCSSSDLAFQHFAIVVTDFDQAYGRLCAVTGWSAISTDGPERLPARSGGVVAFKFRDPDGHPLELLAFPDGKVPPHWRVGRGRGPCIGIDHSAISVSDTGRSVAFYQGLGLQVAARLRNHGPEQGRLDGLIDPHVEVTALVPRQSTPHVELLCYRSAVPHARAILRQNDVAATRIIFARSQHDPDQSNQQLVDPDGHHILLERY
jgi:catechol 2,3-dioxygenase-like lactoylglutathione lyase family enzyme